MKHPFQLIITNRDSTHLFVSVRNYLQVFDLSNGNVCGSWTDDVELASVKHNQKKFKEANPPKSEEKPNGEKKLKNNDSKPVKLPKAVSILGETIIQNYVRSLTLSRDEKYLVGTTDSDKAAIIFEIDLTNKENCLKLVKRQIFPKRPSAVSIGADNDLVVADKFGDVYVTQIDDKPPVDEKSLVPILGHVSMLSDVLLADYNGKKFILTGDRDEHIRVTNYPKAYVVKSWLFGHHEFVSSLHIPKFDPSLLISGGGDDYICLWKWYDNKLISKIQLRDLVAPFLNDSHFPPERFLTEESIKEISVIRILSLEKDSKRLLVVACENIKAFLVFDFSDESSIKHIQTVETSYPIVDICVDDTAGRVICSIDTETQSDLLAYYQFDSDSASRIESDVANKISTSNQSEVESRDDFYPLYWVNTLRKRSEH